MKKIRTLRYASAVVALCAVSLFAVSGRVDEANSQSADLQNGEAGFVVYGFGGAMNNGPTVCPNGRSLGFRQIFEQTPEGRRRPGESNEDYTRRLFAGEQQMARVDGQHLCTNPELADDPNFRIMSSREVVSYGIDLDGQDSRANGAAAAGTCAHDDFTGIGGVRGVDNQMLRVVGCAGSGEAYDAEDTGDLPRGETGISETMLQGGWGILIRLRGVDDLRNDDNVEVGIYANADPIQLGATREALAHSTYATDQDNRFRAETRGRIVNGVLTTEPVNARFHWLVAGFHLERPLNHARIQARFNAEGHLEGYIAGYTPVEAMYDINYGFRSAKTGAGAPAPRANVEFLGAGSSSVMGRTCNGAYHAMLRLADGDRDPQTGRCSSISTQYWFRAIPAFVVDAETSSVNDGL